MTVRVLVVEDEAVAAQAHAAYVRRTEGFALAGVARSGVETLRELRRDAGIDLLLLDMNLPDVHGLELLQRVRAAGFLCDVIAVTSARDVEVVKRAVAHGVVQYLLKPFTYAAFRAKLEQYAAYRRRLTVTDDEVGQEDVDQLLAMLRSAPTALRLPKGMSPDTLRQVTGSLREAGTGRSASEVAADVGASRVTARRYLEYLADSRVVERRVRYGGSGRPEVEYRWSS